MDALQRAEVAGAAPILVVEDDPYVRQLIQVALREEGLTVETVADGQEALLWIHRRRPALVVLDILLPHVPGEEVAEALRETYGNALPILVVTAAGRPQHRVLGVGAVIYLRKPFVIEHLLASVRALLATS